MAMWSSKTLLSLLPVFWLEIFMAAKQKDGSGRKSGKNATAEAGKKSVGRKRSRIRRLLRVFFFVIVFILLAPLFLLAIYRLEFIHPVSAHMVREGVFGHGMQREWVDIEDMSPVLYQSILVSEDGKFCAHNGIDWEALNKVIEDAIDGEKTRGASTITMQMVKNLFLWNGRSYIRKGLEVPLAMIADRILSKKRIMEIYLNTAEWDKGIFGVELAAQNYFGRSATNIGPRHSSLLAVTLPNPKKRNAAKPTRNMNHVAAIVRKRARASGEYVKCLSS
jgi:monofunctional biosynthetic peptidoglycan transglycosylase